MNADDFSGNEDIRDIGDSSRAQIGRPHKAAPYAETKLVRCTRGAIHDVVINLRRQSPTFKDWMAEVLTAENHPMTYLPEGCARGFPTLEDESEAFYQIPQIYNAESAQELYDAYEAMGLTREDLESGRCVRISHFGAS